MSREIFFIGATVLATDKTKEKTLLVNVANIDAIEADSTSTTLVMSSGKTYNVREPVKHFETKGASFGVVRVL